MSGNSILKVESNICLHTSFFTWQKTGREEHQRELWDGPGQAGGGGQGGRVEDQPGRPALLCQWRLTGFLPCQLDRILFTKSQAESFESSSIGSSSLQLTHHSLCRDWHVWQMCSGDIFFFFVFEKDLSCVPQVSLMDNSVQEARYRYSPPF